MFYPGSFPAASLLPSELSGQERAVALCCGHLGDSPALSMGWMQTAEGKGLQR